MPSSFLRPTDASSDNGHGDGHYHVVSFLCAVEPLISVSLPFLDKGSCMSTLLGFDILYPRVSYQPVSVARFWGRLHTSVHVESVAGN